jgi:indoleamine 2,3-dioxygenase
LYSSQSFSPVRGFLPAADPLLRLPPAFGPWEEAASNLPKILVCRRLPAILADLPAFDADRLHSEPELERAMLILSFLGHAYVWGDREPRSRIPPRLAVPWCRIASRLGRPPVLSYASYALHNWRRIDPQGPVALGNIVLLQNFLGGIDEEWFVLIHVDIEAKAAPAISALWPAQVAAQQGDIRALIRQLEIVAAAQEQMCQVLDRMPEHCDPYIYYHRVRPYIHGWKDNPGLPDGVLYEEVAAYGGQPQKFRGETGAQTGIIPALDGALGIGHREDPLRIYLRELREYMPPAHEAFVAAVEQGPSIRDQVLAHHQSHPALREAYNTCIRLVERFRNRHHEYAARYIQLQSQKSAMNPTEVGTGGTPFMRYLQKHKQETSDYLI